MSCFTWANLKKSGRPLVFGASDGRVYQGERRTGVSIFDLSLPKEATHPSSMATA